MTSRTLGEAMIGPCLHEIHPFLPIGCAECATILGQRRKKEAPIGGLEVLFGKVVTTACRPTAGRLATPPRSGSPQGSRRHWPGTTSPAPPAPGRWTPGERGCRSWHPP